MSGPNLDLIRKQAVLKLLEGFRADAVMNPGLLDAKLVKEFKKLLQIAKLSPWWSEAITQKASLINEATSMTQLLSLFPVLTRTQIQQNSERLWVKPGLDKEKGYTKLTTSGSTGKPVTIYRHQKTHQVQHAAAELLDVIWQRRDLSKDIALFKVASENDQQASLGEPFTYLGPTGKAYRRSLASNSVPEILDFLVDNQIKIFLLNPMVLKFLIQEQLRSPRPNAQFEEIMSWVDRLEPELRVKAMEVFGAKLSDRYSSTEFGFLAIQCPEADHLHALQFTNYIEILNSEGQPCAIGEPGRVVVTSLQNIAMPLIRYELGDVAAFGEPCQHGVALPVFEPRIVRTREAILLDDGSLEIPYFDDTELGKHPNLVDYQAYRFQDGLVLVFQAAGDIPEATLHSTKEKLQQVFRTSQQVKLIQLDSLKWLGYWKRKMILDVPKAMPTDLSQEFFESASKKAPNINE